MSKIVLACRLAIEALQRANSAGKPITLSVAVYEQDDSPEPVKTLKVQAFLDPIGLKFDNDQTGVVATIFAEFKADLLEEFPVLQSENLGRFKIEGVQLDPTEAQTSECVLVPNP